MVQRRDRTIVFIKPQTRFGRHFVLLYSLDHFEMSEKNYLKYLPQILPFFATLVRGSQKYNLSEIM